MTEGDGDRCHLRHLLRAVGCIDFGRMSSMRTRIGGIRLMQEKSKLGSFVPAAISIISESMSSIPHSRSALKSQLMNRCAWPTRRLSDVSWIHLSVSSAATEAQHLYERAGFQVWGSEPESLRYEDRTVDEHHMALRLK